MTGKKHWLWIGAGLAVFLAIPIIQQVSTNAESDSPEKDDTVLVQFFAPGNAVRAKVNWTTPEGSETYNGELPLMNTKGSQGVAYRLPRGSAVSMTVTNQGSTGSTNLGFAGIVACRIEVDGYPVVSQDKHGYNASVSCTASAKPPLG
jgi:hypothetical protein